MNLTIQKVGETATELFIKMSSSGSFIRLNVAFSPTEHVEL